MYVSIDWKELLVYSMYLYGGYDMDGGRRGGEKEAIRMEAAQDVELAANIMCI